MTERTYKPLTEWNPKKGDVFVTRLGLALTGTTDTHARFDHWRYEEEKPFSWFSSPNYTLVSRANPEPSFKVGDEVQTRDGREAGIYDVVQQPDGEWKIHGWELVGNGFTRAATWFANGNLIRQMDCPSDLVHKPKVKTVWMSVYSSDGVNVHIVHKDRKDADKVAAEAFSKRIACKKITYTEGEFDE